MKKIPRKTGVAAIGRGQCAGLEGFSGRNSYVWGIEARLFICGEAARSNTLGVLLLVVVGEPLLELTHVQFFRGAFKSCQIF